MIYSLLESLLESIDKILSDGRFSWGAVITALLFFNKINKYKEFRARDQRVELRQLRIESKVDDLMLHAGVDSSWNLQGNTLKKTIPIYLKYWMKLKGVLTMERLKSRKLWMSVFAALLPIINEEFNLGLNTETVIASVGAIVAYILGQAHVDAKRTEVKPNEKPPMDTESSV